MASVLALVSISCEVIPELSKQNPQLTPSSSAQTQNFSDEQVVNYAKAVLKIETHRQQAYQNLQQLIGDEPPEILCNQPKTFKGLSREAQKVAVSYCVTSKSVAEESGLSEDQFNIITLRLQSDEELKKRIQNAMIRLQKEQS